MYRSRLGGSHLQWMTEIHTAKRRSATQVGAVYYDIETTPKTYPIDVTLSFNEHIKLKLELDIDTITQYRRFNLHR